MFSRMDSDVPVPSGRALPLTKKEKLWQKKQGRMGEAKEKTKFAAIMISNCGGKNKRWEYVKLLREHMPVDVYGSCGKLRYSTCTGLPSGF
jgi:glycoprotein 3-alpha-L-fucosyltransferase